MSTWKKQAFEYFSAQFSSCHASGGELENFSSSQERRVDLIKSSFDNFSAWFSSCRESGGELDNFQNHRNAVSTWISIFCALQARASGRGAKFVSVQRKLSRKANRSATRSSVFIRIISYKTATFHSNKKRHTIFGGWVCGCASWLGRCDERERDENTSVSRPLAALAA